MKDSYYIPRRGDTVLSELARRAVDQQRAELAVQVLAATDTSPASRLLYRELLRAGALHPALAVA